MHHPYAIFDLDGTLIDSMGFWQALEREYLEQRGITENLDAVLEELKPLTITEAGRIFTERYGFPGTAESVGQELQRAMDRHYREDIPLKGGVREYLAEQRRLGVRMCAASATAEELMEACLRRLGVLEFFDFTISCVDVGAGKRRPDIYLAAARRLGAEPDEVAVYEDAPYALETARNAGFYTIAVGDAHADWEAARAAAHEAIRHWRDAAADFG